MENKNNSSTQSSFSAAQWREEIKVIDDYSKNSEKWAKDMINKVVSGEGLSPAEMNILDELILFAQWKSNENK